MSRHVIAFDFESFGGIPLVHGFCQLGARLVREEDDAILATFSEYANQEGYVQEERCLKEFWLPLPNKRYEQVVMKCAMSPNNPFQVCELFWKWVDDNAPKDSTVLITDNSAYDTALLKTFTKSRDILYVFGKYRGIIDVTRWYQGVAHLPLNVDTLKLKGTKELALNALGQKELPKLDVQHDHDAVNDALTIALYWCWFQRLVPSVKVLE